MPIPTITKVIHNICKATATKPAKHSIDLLDSDNTLLIGNYYRPNDLRSYYRLLS
jgi:hypothetical protein